MTPQELVDGLLTVKLIDEQKVETRYIFSVHPYNHLDWDVREEVAGVGLSIVGFSKDRWHDHEEGFSTSGIYGRSVEDAVRKLVVHRW